MRNLLVVLVLMLTACWIQDPTAAHYDRSMTSLFMQLEDSSIACIDVITAHGNDPTFDAQVIIEICSYMSKIKLAATGHESQTWVRDQTTNYRYSDILDTADASELLYLSWLKMYRTTHPTNKE